MNSALYAFGVVDPLERNGEGRGHFPIPGIFIVPLRDLGVITRMVDADEFGSERPEWLTQQIMFHETVLEKMMAEQTVVPFRFGTLLSSPEKIRERLEQKYDDFKRLLKEFCGQEEWGVRVECEADCWADWVAHKEGASLFGLHGGTLLDSAGTNYLLQKRGQLALVGAQRKWAEKYRQAIIQEVARFSQRILPMEHVQGDSLLSITCLVRHDRQIHFTSDIGQLAHAPDWGPVQVKVSGPFPPYSFCEDVKGSVS